jgi:hypothetical protein
MFTYISIIVILTAITAVRQMRTPRETLFA